VLCDELFVVVCVANCEIQVMRYEIRDMTLGTSDALATDTHSSQTQRNTKTQTLTEQQKTD
jgi:hypothetical protein